MSSTRLLRFTCCSRNPNPRLRVLGLRLRSGGGLLVIFVVLDKGAKRGAAMAGEGDLRSSAKKPLGDADDDLPIFTADNIQSNIKSIYYSRTFLSIIGGVIAGIWGFTGLKGFLFYFLVMAAASLGLAAKAKFSIHTYFDSWNRIVLDGIFGGLMSFVLFWTFAYDIVHIF